MKKLSEGKLGWLAEIIDGDGTFMITKASREGHLRPEIAVVNGDKKIIEKISKILDRNDIKKTIWVYKKSSRHRRVYIRNQRAILKLIKILLPYLVKKRDAKILKKFTELRIRSKGKWRGKNKFGIRSHTKKELELFYQLKNLHYKNQSKKTKRSI